MVSFLLKQLLGAAVRAALDFFREWQRDNMLVAKGKAQQRIKELEDAEKVRARMGKVKRVSRDDLVDRLRRNGEL